jgi:hypothetical protein
LKFLYNGIKISYLKDFAYKTQFEKNTRNKECVQDKFIDMVFYKRNYKKFFVVGEFFRFLNDCDFKIYYNK